MRNLSESLPALVEVTNVHLQRDCSITGTRVERNGARTKIEGIRNIQLLSLGDNLLLNRSGGSTPIKSLLIESGDNVMKPKKFFVETKSGSQYEFNITYPEPDQFVQDLQRKTADAATAIING